MYSDQDKVEIRYELESLYYHFDKQLPNNKAMAIISEAEPEYSKAQLVHAIRRVKYSDRPFMTKDIFKQAKALAEINKPEVGDDCMYCNKFGLVTAVSEDDKEYFIQCVCTNKQEGFPSYSEENHKVKYPIHNFELTDKEQKIYEKFKHTDNLNEAIREAGFEL